MANKYYNETDIQNIANAIRVKNGTTNTYTVSQMADAITELSIGGNGGIVPTGNINITGNGTFDVTQYAQAIVNVASSDGASGSINGTSMGTIIVTENITDSTTGVTVEHGLGTAPSQILITSKNAVGMNVKGTVGGFYMGEGVICGASCSADDTKTLSLSVKSIANVTETSFSFVPRSASYPIPAGEYVWLVL